jgi:tRNA pseudouridine38-40 synthase
MTRHHAVLAYDGSNFQGSQKQANRRTAQGEFEKALRSLGWLDKSALVAGRTDAGVHATGQTVAFDLEWPHPEDELLRALNGNLPHDLAVRELRVTTNEFHPRFDATSREYRYRLFCDPIRDPLREKFLWRVYPSFDEGALIKNASLFLGQHDFSAFGSRISPKGTTTRTVTKSEWRKISDGEWRYEVKADAFLYRMVRRLVAAQISVAQGKRSVAEIHTALTKQGKLFVGLAPAHGLTLIEVTY